MLETGKFAAREILSRENTALKMVILVLGK